MERDFRYPVNITRNRCLNRYHELVLSKCLFLGDKKKNSIDLNLNAVCFVNKGDSDQRLIGIKISEQEIDNKD